MFQFVLTPKTWMKVYLSQRSYFASKYDLLQVIINRYKDIIGSSGYFGCVSMIITENEDDGGNMF